MDVTLVHCETAGGRLHGFVAGDEGPLALHLHGTWGNFYENPFVTAVADAYLRQGWRYGSVNLPSHDAGSVREEMSDSLEAIRAWTTLLAPSGEPLLLQGHSLGALKAIRLVHESEYHDVTSRVAGLVLLSPFDIVAFYGGADTRAIERSRATVGEVADRDGEAANVPANVFDLWPISAATYLAVTENDGVWDVFPSRTGEHPKWVAGTGLPTLVGIGGEDFAAFPNPTVVANALRDVPGTTVAVVPGAPHNFAGREDALREHIHTFVAMLT